MQRVISVYSLVSMSRVNLGVDLPVDIRHGDAVMEDDLGCQRSGQTTRDGCSVYAPCEVAY